MSRERRNFNRLSGIKDPSLIVIACEGEKTEQQYFDGVSDICEEFGARLKLKILPPRQQGESAPKHVLAQMDNYRKEFGINSYDELCLVIDRDKQSWSEGHISDIARHCSAKKYLLAVSNPSFELWLLLHHLDISSATERDKELVLENKRGYMKRKIREVIGSYNPARIDIHDFWERTNIAIERARNLDTNPEERWPNSIGSRIYILLNKILDSIKVI